MTHPENESLVRALEEAALLMDLAGENPFKIRAFQGAARILEDLEAPAGDLLASGALARMKGVGKGILAAVGEFLETGTLAAVEALRARVPAVAMEMLRIPALGPAKVRALLEHLELDSLDDLEAACLEDRLPEVKGFGSRTQLRILEGIRFLKKNHGLFWLGAYLHAALDLEKGLSELEAVQGVSLAGGLRRRREVVGSLDLVAAAEDRGRAGRAVQDRLEAGDIEVSSRSEDHVAGRHRAGIPVRCHLVAPAAFPAALVFFTGSADHVAGLEIRATHQGLALGPAGLTGPDGPVEIEDEAGIYTALDLQWIPPELREARGEIEAASQAALPRLLEASDLRGCFHVHSTASDGANTLEEIARHAGRLGLDYVGMADHSRSAAYAGGLSARELLEQGEAIDALNRRGAGARLLKGVESDILADGSLDYPDDVLARLDFVVGSIHSGLAMDRATATARVVKALEQPRLTQLGHPTGRLLLGRKGYDLDWERVLAAARAHGKVIEVNAHPSRLDLDWRRVREAVGQGVQLAVNPDAHDLKGFEDLEYGVCVARKGWATAGDVVNTRGDPPGA